jgi:hypothetical protein
MNKIYKNVLIIIMALIVIYQVFFISKINKEKNVTVYNNINREVINYKSLKDINEELSCLKEKNILSANEINGKWYVKVKIQGNKEELLSEISKLKSYEISDYIINRANGENSMVLEICSKENI